MGHDIKVEVWRTDKKVLRGTVPLLEEIASQEGVVRVDPHEPFRVHGPDRKPARLKGYDQARHEFILEIYKDRTIQKIHVPTTDPQAFLAYLRSKGYHS